MSREYFGSGRDRHYKDEFDYSDNNYGATHSRNGISNSLPGAVRGRSRSISRSSSRSRSIGTYGRANNRRDSHYEEPYSPYRTTYGPYDYYTGSGDYYNNRDMSRTPSPVAHFPGLSHPPNEGRYGRYRLREGRSDDFIPAHSWEDRPNYDYRHYYDDPSPRGRRYSTDSYYRSRSRSRSPYDYFGRDSYLRNRRSPSPPRGEYARASSRSRERRYYGSPLDRSPNYLQRDRPWEGNGLPRRERGRAYMRPRFNSPRGGPRQRHNYGMRRDSNRSLLSEGEVDSKSSRQLSTKSPSPGGSNVPSPDRAPGEPEQRQHIQPPPPTTPIPAPPPTQAPPPPVGRGGSYYPMAPRFQQSFSQPPPYFVPGRGNNFPPQTTQPHNFPPRIPPWVPRDVPRDMGFFQRPDLPRPPFHIPSYRPNRPPPRYPPSSNRPTSFDRSAGLHPSEPKPCKADSPDLPPGNKEPVKLLNTAFLPPPPPTSNAPQSIIATSPPKHVLPHPPSTYMPNRRSSATFLRMTPKPDFLIQFESGLYPHPWPSKLDDDFHERAVELRRLRASEAEIRASLARSKFDLLLSSLEIERLELSLNTKASNPQ